MLVNIVYFPAIKAGKDGEFRQWFAWTNEEYAKFPGFISRKLLVPREGGNYAAVVEHESNETFKAMHGSTFHAEAQKRVLPLLDGYPTPHFYEEVSLHEKGKAAVPAEHSK
ncbi:MAG: antibiotic biosynthesis monooxygenase [Sporomusaceae bacterium]|nr:antibiotic biosynthesis monooxygenase [Sporomusaceae bacterium]